MSESEEITGIEESTSDGVSPEPVVDDLLVEEVSIDGMCGVY